MTALERALAAARRDKENEQNSKTVGESNVSSSSSSSLMDRALNAAKRSKYENAVDTDNIETWRKDVNELFNDISRSSRNASWSSYNDNNASYHQRWADLQKRGNEIADYYKKNQIKLNANEYTAVTKMVEEANESGNRLINQFSDIGKYFSQFGSDEDYNNTVKYGTDFVTSSKYDSEAGKKKIDNAQNAYDILSDYEKTYKKEIEKSNFGAIPTDYYNNVKKVMDDTGYTTASEAKKALDEETSAMNRHAHTVEVNDYFRNAQNDPEFDKYAQMGADIENPTMKDVMLGKKIGNYVTYSRDNADAIRGTAGAQSMQGRQNVVTGDYRLQEMTDDEVKTYNYYLAKENAGLVEKGTAEKFLNSIQDYINQRYGAYRYENELKDNPLYEQVFAFAVGWDQFREGVKANFNTSDNHIALSDTQYAGQLVREDVQDDLKFGNASLSGALYDLTSTTANQIPSMAVSTLVSSIAGPEAGKIAGAATLGFSAAGNAYAEMLNAGYTKGQSRAYSAMVGASEAGLEYLLGGINKLGGKLTGNVIKKVTDGISSAALKTALEFGGEMMSEFTEETLQDLIEPVFKSMATQEKISLPDNYFSNALYSGLLGAISAGILNGAGAINSNALTLSQVRDAKNMGTYNKLIEAGKMFSADSVAYKIAESMPENPTVFQMAKLVNAERGIMTEQNIMDIKSGLMREGVVEADAETISQWMAKAVNEGTGKFTAKEAAALDKNPILQRVYKKYILDHRSTINKRASSFDSAFKGQVEYGMDFSGQKKANENVIESVNNQIAEREADYKLRQYLMKENMRGQDIANGTDRTGYSGALNAKLNSMAENAVREARSAETRNLQREIAEARTASLEGVSDTGRTVMKGSGADVSISKIDSVKDGKLTLKTSDGNTVSTDDVYFATPEEAFVYEYLPKTGMPVEAMNAVVNQFKAAGNVNDVVSWVMGVTEAYKRGYIGQDLETVTSGTFIDQLTEREKNFAYKLGETSAKNETKRRKAFSEARAVLNKGERNRSGSEQGIIVDNGLMKGMNARQRESVNAIARLTHDIIGNRVYLFETVEDSNGTYVFKDDIGVYKKGEEAPNGFYDPNTGDIYLDINSGYDAEGTMLWTYAHELTHFIREWSPEQFKKLADFVVKSYGEKGVNVSELVDRQMESLTGREKDASIDRAYEEMVADSMITMFTDTDLMNKLYQLKKESPSLYNKVKSWVNSQLKKLRELYEGLEPDTDEALLIRSMEDKLQSISDTFAEAVSEAERVYNGPENTSLSEEQITALDKEGYTVLDNVIMTKENAKLAMEQGWHTPERLDDIYSYKTVGAWEKAVRDKYKSKEEADRVINAVKSFTDMMVSDDAVRGIVPMGNYKYNKKGPLRTNVEYKFTFDMDTSCPRTFQFLYFRDRLQESAGRPLTYNESVNLLEAMRILNLEIPCSYCYVENKRVLRSEGYNKFFQFRNAVLNEQDYEVAKTLMYGYNEKTGELTNASQKAFDNWKSNPGYNPTVEEVWRATNTSRNSVFNYLDSLYKDNLITTKQAQKKIEELVNNHFGLTSKKAMKEVSGFVSEWVYDTYAEKTHQYIMENNTDVSLVDESALELNKEAIDYANSSSSAKTVSQYVPYSDQLKNITKADKAYIIGMGGLRKHSSNDFRIEYVQDYFMLFADMARGGWTGHTYTKSELYAKIFGRTGDRINLSIAYYEDADGTLRENTQEGMGHKVAKELAKNYGNIGVMAMVTSDIQLSAALNDEGVNMIIPFHHSSLDRNVWYDLRHWFDYTAKQNERFLNANEMKLKMLDKMLTDAGVEHDIEGMKQELIEAAKNSGAGADSKEAGQIIQREVSRLKKLATDNGIEVPTWSNSEETDAAFTEMFHIKKYYDENGNRVKPHFLPGDTMKNGVKVPGHGNDLQEYFRLCESWGVKPRFDGVAVQDANGNYINVTDHPGYLKLIKETSRTDSEQTPIQFNFDEEDEYLGTYVDKETGETKTHTPFSYAMEQLRLTAESNPNEKIQQDVHGLLKIFREDYLGKDRPIGYKSRELAYKEAILKSDYDTIEQIQEHPEMYESARRKGDRATPREILANALESTAETDADRKRIKSYKENIKNMNQAQEDLKALKASIAVEESKKNPDPAQISAMKLTAESLENRIRRFDEELLQMESTKLMKDVLIREKERARQRGIEEGRRGIAEIKSENARRLEELRKQHATERQEEIERRYQDETRRRILDKVAELNKLLTQGDKDNHVPEAMQAAVAEVMESINVDDSANEEWFEDIEDRIQNAKTEKERQRLEAMRQREIDRGESIGQRMAEMQRAYTAIKDAKSSEVNAGFDENVAGYIQEVRNSIGDTKLSEMTAKQLSDVYTVYRMVLKTIRNANKAFLIKRATTIKGLGTDVMREVKEAGGTHGAAPEVVNALKRFGWANLKPIYAMRALGSDTMLELYKNVRKGEDTYALDATEAKNYFLEQADKYKFNEWDMDKEYEFRSRMGQKFTLRLGDIMSIYAYSKREQASEHLSQGGVVLESEYKKKYHGIPLTYTTTSAKAYNLSPENISKIIATLTQKQKEFVDEMQKYLSEVMGEKGNEVSQQLYDVKLFKEKNYFPLKSADQYMFKTNEASGMVKLKNGSFSKATVKNANNPVMLRPFMQVWSEHVRDMSMYHSFVLPLEDFNRVFGYHNKASADSESSSVKSIIQNAYGKAANDYITQLITDLNAGARSSNGTEFANKMTALFKKGATFASASVIIQQPSAIARAFSMVDPKYFKETAKDSWNFKNVESTWEECKKYAPVAIIKEMGYFDTNLGRSTEDWMVEKNYKENERGKAFIKDSAYRDEILGMAPGLADEVTWCHIWNAVKLETEQTTDLQGEELLQAAGERFTDVVQTTQVYDSVLSRSGLMRSKDTGVKMATAFMAEPTTSFNMLAYAILDYKRTGNAEQARRTIGSVVAQAVLNSALVSLVYAARDDDKDKTYLEKYIGKLSGSLLDSVNPLTMIPYVKDIVSIVQGYDVERSDMQVISDLYSAFKSMGNGNMSAYKRFEKFTGAVAAMFGLPVKNIMRDADAVFNIIQEPIRVAMGNTTTIQGIGESIASEAFGVSTKNAESLYKAYLSGNRTMINRVTSRYKDEDKASTAVKGVIKDRYDSGKLSRSSAESQLVKYCGMTENDAYWYMDKAEYKKKNGTDDGYSKYDTFLTAVRTGKNLKDTITKYTKYGVSKEQLASAITSGCKEAYVNASKKERQKMLGYLLNAYEALGYDRTKKQKDIANWVD